MGVVLEVSWNSLVGTRAVWNLHSLTEEDRPYYEKKWGPLQYEDPHYVFWYLRFSYWSSLILKNIFFSLWPSCRDNVLILSHTQDRLVILTFSCHISAAIDDMHHYGNHAMFSIGAMDILMTPHSAVQRHRPLPVPVKYSDIEDMAWFTYHNWWTCINETKTFHADNIILRENENVVVDSNEVCEILNDYFSKYRFFYWIWRWNCWWRSCRTEAQ